MISFAEIYSPLHIRMSFVPNDIKIFAGVQHIHVDIA